MILNRKEAANGRDQAVIGPETFRFFRELGRNNSKAWMDANRELYQSAVVEPMRGLLAQLTPAALKLYPWFDVCGRTGVNFSRINRDIRFAKDKTPYRAQMYLIFPDGGNRGSDRGRIGPDGGTIGVRAEKGIRRDSSHAEAETARVFFLRAALRPGGAPRHARNDNVGRRALGDGGKNRRPGELYLGVNAKLVTVGYRVYFDGKTKAAALDARTEQAPKWCAQQKRRLGRQFESYWYSFEKGGVWTKNDGWPVTPEEWKKLKAWVVRKKLSSAAAARPGFAKDVAKIFRHVMPLFRFVCQ